ncbi:MAG: hypothetical protein HZC22_16375 [Rhodocyclales bacterium]|nr:hypothetical protein [Rhodocyclales bacterium]
MKRLAALLIAATLAGCAAYQPVPEGYAGPIARISDSGQSEDGTKAKVFALSAVDGNSIRDSFRASAAASHNRGATLILQVVSREVPAQPMKVTLKASHITGAPIHAMASKVAGTFFSVEGTVDFSPKANGSYVVKGELKKGGSSVWIEDADTGQPVTEKVVEK